MLVGSSVVPTLGALGPGSAGGVCEPGGPGTEVEAPGGCPVPAGAGPLRLAPPSGPGAGTGGRRNSGLVSIRPPVV